MIDILVQQALVLRRCGLSESELEGALRSFNLERCDPPKSDDEVKRIAQWAAQRDVADPDAIGVPEVVRLSDIEPTEVRWLAEPYIPLGKVTLLEGDPGVGKTYVALDMIAAITRGQSLFE